MSAQLLAAHGGHLGILRSGPNPKGLARADRAARLPRRRASTCPTRLARHADDFARVHREAHVAHRRYGWGETPAVTDGEVANL